MEKLIALCMIVKNEEDVLDRCLNSVHQFVDEIIIVDTGSTDSTKSIAQKYTNQIYDFQWINDFSAARNESLKHATAKWILVLDADEYMEETDIRGLREFLSNQVPQKHILYQLNVINFLGETHNSVLNEANVTRIHANHMGIHYFRPLHEQLTCAKATNFEAVKLAYPIYHSGYLQETIQKKNKHERNMSIFDSMKKRAKLNPYDQFTLGNQLLMMKRNEEALDAYQQAWQNSTKQDNWIPMMMVSVIQAYTNLERHVEAWNYFEKHLALYLGYSDIRTLRGIILKNLGFFEQAQSEFVDAIQQAEQRQKNNQKLSLVSPDYCFTVPAWQLVEMYELERNYKQCIYFLTKLAIVNPKDFQAQMKLTEILALHEKAEDIASFLDKLLTIGEDKLKLGVIGKIAIALGNIDLARYYIKHYTLSDLLAFHDVLAYHLLDNDQSGFERSWLSGTKIQIQHPFAVKYLILAAVVWQKPEWIERLNLNEAHESFDYTQFAHTILTQAVVESNEKTSALATDLLSGLYVFHQFDAYDRLIDFLDSPDVINRLAHFFFAKHWDSTALQYFSHLENQQVLSAESFTYLAFIRLNEQRTEDALLYLQAAITLKPRSKHLYILYCSNSQDLDAKQKMKERLLAVDPLFDKLSLFHSL